MRKRTMTAGLALGRVVAMTAAPRRAASTQMSSRL
jgi:hypothetical protein